MARTVERPNRYFTFLRRLRADGRSNMYGAIPYLAAAFGIDRNESFRIVCEWIDAQAAPAAEPSARKSVIPAERAAAPTLFDPVPMGPPSVSPEPAEPRKHRKPVKQRASATQTAPSRTPKVGTPKVGTPKVRAPKTSAVPPKKPRRPSDSRAA